MTRSRSRIGMLIVTGMLAALIPASALPATAATTGDLLLTGVIDGPLPGGVPKAVELYVANDIPDLSIYGLGSANNGGGSDGEEFTFPATGASAGDFIYVASEAPGFLTYFGFDPDFTTSAVDINGNDAIELFSSGAVVDVFGEATFGNPPGWAHTDGWVYRVNQTGQDGAGFVPENWTTSGMEALDGETSNATAAFPFPIGTYSANTPPPPPPSPANAVINEVDSDTAGVDSAEFVELYDGGAGNTSLDGMVLVFYNGSDSLTYDSVDLDGLSTDVNGYATVCGDADAIAAECDLDSSVGIQNGADGVALYQGDASDFPMDTAVTIDGLVDAVVYDTADADVPALLALLNPGQPQVDENGGGDGPGHSSQRCPDGSGGPRNTETFAQFAPTIGVENQCSVTPPGPVARKIHEIQGTAAASPLEGDAVVVEAVVVGDFQGDAALRGFNLQEEDTDVDSDSSTSEGIFVFDGSFGVDVAMGDLVEVKGIVDEFSGLTEITSVTSVTIVSSGQAVTPATIALPVATLEALEPAEGMAVVIPQELVISEFFNFDRFGEIVLTSERQFQPTALYEPGSPEAAQQAIDNQLGRITLDDGRTSQNPDPAIHPNGEVFDLDNLFRSGDGVSNVTGVLDYAFGLYRVHPTGGADFTVENPRPKKPPRVGSSLEVATFNVLNYFSTIDTGAFICGPLADQECRGADNVEEFSRQRDKIIAAIAKIDADVVGLMEIENHVTDAALADLVAGLNDKLGPGTYAYVGEGSIGPDAIRVGLIYKPRKVVPLGDDAVLDSDGFLDPNHLGGAQNRPAQAQTFQQRKTGESLTVVVNHLKSKGSGCGPGDDDPVQGNCNVTRTLAAQALADWLATDPTGSGDPDFLIIGDLNSYDKESPIDVLTAGGFTDLAGHFEGEEAYSYLFDGQLGYLDYALANQPMLEQVTGAGVWHLNADEPDIIDYDTSFKMDAQDALYAPDPFRSSDHDAVVVGLELDGTPPRVRADLDRIWSGHDTGLFRVDFACRDEVDRRPDCVADLNGIDVRDGQMVFLIRSSGDPWSFGAGNTLFLKAETFLLAVTGTDDAGNSATETTEPIFHHHRPWR